MNKGFEGWYFKHQKDGLTLALIPGRSRERAFVFVVTDERVYDISFPTEAYRLYGNRLMIGDNLFSPKGVELDIHGEGIELSGALSYGELTPIASDIMGPFRFFPMECRHEIVSMRHALHGTLTLGGEALCFSGGVGYIEGDSGRSFPSQYAWAQCNAFSGNCSVMVSIARIPFAGFRFWGCISVVWLNGREYRLATYRGARIESFTNSRLALRQGGLRLIVELQDETQGICLPAPQEGEMRRVIHESPVCTARFVFADRNGVLFDETSGCASFEFVG